VSLGDADARDVNPYAGIRQGDILRAGCLLRIGKVEGEAARGYGVLVPVPDTGRSSLPPVKLPLMWILLFLRPAVAGVYVTLTVQFEPGALVEKQVVQLRQIAAIGGEAESCSGTVPSPSASPAAECWGVNQLGRKREGSR